MGPDEGRRARGGYPVPGASACRGSGSSWSAPVLSSEGCQFGASSGELGVDDNSLGQTFGIVQIWLEDFPDGDEFADPTFRVVDREVGAGWGSWWGSHGV